MCLHKIWWLPLPILITFATIGTAQIPNAQNKVWSDQFIVEPPTLLCAGFQWKINGDKNRNATVTVRFQKYGEEDWQEALPLLRIGGETIYGHDQRWLYEVGDAFAGSIFNLNPDTQYTCEFTLRDPDGIVGDSIIVRQIQTKSVPKPYTEGKIYHVYPPGYEGDREEPSFTGLNEAYYGQGNLGDWWLVPDARAQPGDIILVHAGTYQGDLLNYVDPLALQFHGAYVLTQKGTPDRPITIKAAGDGPVVFDGAGAYRLFDVMAADYHIFEGLEIRNTDIAFYAGLKHVKGCSGLSVINCRIEDVGIAVMTHSEQSRDFYIADNVMIGRHDPDTLHGWHGFDHPAPVTSYFAVKVYGQSHVICHNDISFFHDGICVDTHGLPEDSEDEKCVSIDIYRNDIFNMSDDFIEADGGVHNIRIFENRGFNAYHAGLSAQPVFGGPVYFIRNIIYQVQGTSLKYTIRPAGILAYHNTFCAETSFNTISNGHFRNNLFLGHTDRRPSLSGSTSTTYTTLDYNGYRVKPMERSFRWKSPATSAENHVDIAELTSYDADDFQEFRIKTGYESHGVAVDYDIFRSVQRPDPEARGKVYSRDGYDFHLKPGSNASDRGLILPNINDVYEGSAPDLGAAEGNQETLYGPRNPK